MSQTTDRYHPNPFRGTHCTSITPSCIQDSKIPLNAKLIKLCWVESIFIICKNELNYVGRNFAFNRTVVARAALRFYNTIKCKN